MPDRIKNKRTNIATQLRCIYCHKEQYALAVYKVSRAERACSWCGKTPPILTEEEYRDKYKCGRASLADIQKFENIANEQQNQDNSDQSEDSASDD